MSNGLRVTVWNEGVHEQNDAEVRAIYPEGLGGAVANALKEVPGIASVRLVQLDDPGQGIDDTLLAETDVMTWWGHCAHDRLTEENAAKVQRRVLEGMGFIALHSAHFSKPFIRLMGTTCELKYREWGETGERERIWIVDPAHPVAANLPEHFCIESAEMYGEPFDIPHPDHLVFISWFQGGEVFRSGCAWHRGRGKVFYFRPGHESYPVYRNPHVLQVIGNAVLWAAPTPHPAPPLWESTPPLEEM